MPLTNEEIRLVVEKSLQINVGTLKKFPADYITSINYGLAPHSYQATYNPETDIYEIMPLTSLTAPSGATFRQEITESSLSVDGYATINHGLNNELVDVTIYNGNGVKMEAQEIQILDANTLVVNLNLYRVIVGTWEIFIES